MIKITSVNYNKNEGDVNNVNVIKTSMDLAKNYAKMFGINELDLNENKTLMCKVLENSNEVLEISFMWINED